MKRLIGLSAALLLQACGGGHPDAPRAGTRSPPPPPVSIDAGGLWQGNFKGAGGANAGDAVAMIAEDGRVRIISLVNDVTLESHFFLTTAVFEGSGYRYAGFLDDGSDTPYSHGISLYGNLAERDSLAVSWTTAWEGEGSLKFTYDPELYEVPSSLDDLTGTWTAFDDDYEPWLTLTVDADGHFVGDVISGCNPSGRFAVIDERFNLYDVQDVIFDCGDGSEFSGLAYTFGDNVSDPALFVSMDNGTEALRLEVIKD